MLLYSRVFPPAVGGMERFADELARWLTEHGHEVTVVTYTAADQAADRNRPYQVLRCPKLGAVVRASRQADVVHVNGLSVRGVGVALAAMRRPIVSHQGHQAVCPTGLAWNHGKPCEALPRSGPCSACPESGLRPRVSLKVHRTSALVASVNVCVSQYLAAHLGLSRSRVIYNPVSQAAFQARANGLGQEGLVAFAGRLVEEKGLDLLLRALALLPTARLEVAGDGPMRGEWEALATSLGLRSRVKFLGSLSFQGVAELYARTAVVCVPSLWDEPFGYAVAEAMAMERPVVGTPRGALSELLADGRGFVASAATPEALAEALAVALDDGPRRLEAAAKALAFARAQLSLNVAGLRYVECYHDAAR